MSEELNPPRFPTMLRKMWSGSEVQAWIDENWNRRAQPASPADAAPSVAPEPPTREALAEIVRSHLTSTYHCTRVWEAWHVGTMTEDDFEPASESDMAEDIADAILANHPPRAPLTEEQIEWMQEAASRINPDELVIRVADLRAVLGISAEGEKP